MKNDSDVLCGMEVDPKQEVDLPDYCVRVAIIGESVVNPSHTYVNTSAINNMLKMTARINSDQICSIPAHVCEPVPQYIRCTSRPMRCKWGSLTSSNATLLSRICLDFLLVSAMVT